MDGKQQGQPQGRQQGPQAQQQGQPQGQQQGPQGQQQQNINHDLAAITLSSRISPFWRDMPRMWFAQFEAVAQNQNETVKYDLVLSKLGREELSQVTDLIDEPPAQQRYTMLKQRLLKVFQESAEAQFHKLVKEMDLGTQRPSQLLAKMKDLARNSGTGGDTLRNLWLSRMPGWVRAILVCSGPNTTLDDLATLADKVMDNLRSGEVAAVDTSTTASTSGTSNPSISVINLELLTQVRDLSADLNAYFHGKCRPNAK
ncbi:hypothetical protein O0L34_g15423 [Tuta absoluta]|nr:hypothetical protein O0L34_g15423 [Tuta absoluta]